VHHKLEIFKGISEQWDKWFIW